MKNTFLTRKRKKIEIQHKTKKGKSFVKIRASQLYSAFVQIKCRGEKKREMEKVALKSCQIRAS